MLISSLVQTTRQSSSPLVLGCLRFPRNRRQLHKHRASRNKRCTSQDVPRSLSSIFVRIKVPSHRRELEFLLGTGAALGARWAATSSSSSSEAGVSQSAPGAHLSRGSVVTPREPVHSVHKLIPPRPTSSPRAKEVPVHQPLQHAEQWLLLAWPCH